MDETVPARTIFETAARCADCAEGSCMKACPAQVDLRALFEFIAAHAPAPVAWPTDERAAEDFADAAIARSFSV